MGLQEELTVSILEKCKQSQPVIKRIIERTTDDEAMLFEALNLHDELQQVVSKYEELEASQKSEGHQLENSKSTKYEGLGDAQEPPAKMLQNIDTHHERLEDAHKSESAAFGVGSPSRLRTYNETKVMNSQKGESPDSGREKKDE